MSGGWKSYSNFFQTNWRRRYIIVVGTYSLFCMKRQPPFYWARYFKANINRGECRTSVWINLPCLLISKAISYKGPLVKIPMTNIVTESGVLSRQHILDLAWRFGTLCVIHTSFYYHYISFHCTIHHTSLITSNIAKNERVRNHNMCRKLNRHITPIHLLWNTNKKSHIRSPSTQPFVRQWLRITSYYWAIFLCTENKRNKFRG